MTGPREWTTETAAAALQKAERDCLQAEQQHARIKQSLNESASRVISLRGRLQGLREALLPVKPEAVPVPEPATTQES